MEARPQHVRRVEPAAAARRTLAFLALRDLRHHRHEVARETQTQPALAIEQVQWVGDLVAGEGEHAFVHRPECDLGPLALAAGILDGDPHRGRVAGPVFGALRRQVHREPLALGCHPELRVSHPYRGTAWVIHPAGLGAAPPRDHDRYEGVRGERLGDGELQGRAAAREAEPALLDQTFALDGDPRVGIGEGRGKEHGGRVADAVSGAVGDHVHLELALVVPRHPVLAGRPAGKARHHLTAGLVPGPHRDDVRAAAGRSESAGRRLLSRDQRAARDRVGHPLADDLAVSFPFAVGLVPFAPDHGPLHRDACLSGAIGPHREDTHADRTSGGPEVALGLRLGSEVERRRVDQHRRGRRDGLPIYVLHGGFERGERWPPLGRVSQRKAKPQPSRCIERVGPARGHLHGRAIVALFPPPAGVAEIVPLGAWDLGRTRVTLLAQGPANRCAPHRRTEQVPRFDGSPDRVPREPRSRIGAHVHQELGRTVFGDAIIRLGDVGPASLAAKLDRDLVGAEPRGGGHGKRQIGGAEGGEPGDRLLEHAPALLALPIAEHPPKRVGRGWQAQPAQQAGADDGLGVERLARSVDAALGEHRRRQRKTIASPGGVYVEPPRAQVRIVLTDPDDRTIGSESR